MKKVLSQVLILAMMMSLFVMSPVSANDAAFELISYSSQSGSLEDGTFTLSGGLNQAKDGTITITGDSFKLDLNEEMTAKTKTGVTAIEMKFTVGEVSDTQCDYLYPVLGDSKWNSYQPVMRTLATTHGSYPCAIQFFGSYRSDFNFKYTGGTMAGASVKLKLFLDAVNDAATVHVDITDANGVSQSFVSSPAVSMAKVYPIAENGIDFFRVSPPTGSVVDYVNVEIAQNASDELYYRLGALPFVDGATNTTNTVSKVKSVLNTFAASGDFDFGSFISDSNELPDNTALELLNYVKNNPYAENSTIQKLYTEMVQPSISYPSEAASSGFSSKLYASSFVTEDGKINIQHSFKEDSTLESASGVHIELSDDFVEKSKSLTTIVETEFTYGTINDQNGSRGNHDRFICLVNYPGTTSANYQPIFQTLMREDRADYDKKIRGFGMASTPQINYLTPELLEGAHFKVKYIMDMQSDLMALYVDFTPNGSDVTRKIYGYVDLTKNETYKSFKDYGVKYIKMYPSADTIVDYFNVKMVEPDSDSIYYALLSAADGNNAKSVLDAFEAKGMFKSGLGESRINFSKDVAPALLNYVMDNGDATNAQIQTVYDNALNAAFVKNGVKAVYGNVVCDENFGTSEFNVTADLKVLEATDDETANLVVAQYVKEELVKLDFVPYSMAQTGDFKMYGSITPDVADGYIKVFALICDSLDPLGGVTRVNPAK